MQACLVIAICRSGDAGTMIFSSLIRHKCTTGFLLHDAYPLGKSLQPAYSKQKLARALPTKGGGTR